MPDEFEIVREDDEVSDNNDCIVPRELLPVVLAPQNKGGLFDRFGEGADEIVVLTPHIFVFFENLPALLQTKRYQNAVESYLMTTAIDRANPEAVEKAGTEAVGIILKNLGERVAAYRRHEYVTNSGSQGHPSEIEALIGYSDLLANCMEHTAGVDLDLGDSEDRLYQGLGSRLDKLWGYGREVRRGPSLEIPPIHPLEVSFDGIELSAGIVEAELQEDRPLGKLAGGYNATAGAHIGGSPEGLKGAAERQRDFIKPNVLGVLEGPGELNPTDLPEIVILRGVGQSEADWRDRIDFYRKRGVKVRFIDWPPFGIGDTFGLQAEWLYGQLQRNRGGKPYAMEAHSWGGLVLTHFLDKYPNMLSHIIVSGAPTRSKEDNYPQPLVAVLKFCLDNPKIGQGLIDKVPQLEFFRKIGGWAEAFRVYLAHLGKEKDTQWDDLFTSASWVTPKLYLYGAKDSPVEQVGWGAVLKSRGALVVVNPNGEHDPIGDHEIALETHIRLRAKALDQRRAIIPKGGL